MDLPPLTDDLVVKMYMPFYWKNRIKHFIFDDWHGNTDSKFFGVCAFVIICTFVLEFLAFYKGHRAKSM